MAKKKKTAKKKTAAEPLVLTSRIKKTINKLGYKVSSDVPDAVNDIVVEALKAAVKRTKANGRATVRSYDL